MSHSPRILFLTKYARNGASSRYRSYQYVPHLEKAGFHCAVSPLFDEDYLDNKYRIGRARIRDVLAAFARRCRTLITAHRYDLVVIEKEILPYFFALPEQWLHFTGTPYVADYDDALFHQYDEHPRPWIRFLLGKKIARVMSGARLVTVGNSYLADYAEKAGAQWVEILPTVIDLERYPVSSKAAENPIFTIGWIGSPSTAKYVKQIAPALKRVCLEGAAVIRLIGSGEIALEGIPHEVVPWSENSEFSELQRCDVGIMPLPDEPWERGKCGFKLIQYMGCSLPVVASPVGVNSEIVEEGLNGYLASSEDEWVAALNRLHDDHQNKRKMGLAGRHTVESSFSLGATAPILIGFLKTIFSPNGTITGEG